LFWKSKYTVYFNVLTDLTANLPDGYYHEGDASTQCSAMKTSPDTAFKYCEDISFWELHGPDGRLEERRVVVSCDAGRRQWNTVMGPLLNPEPRGSLWTYSPTSGQTTRLSLQGFPANHTFHPLGLEAYPSYSANGSYLYVVNHAAHKTVVEHFLLSPTSNVARYIRTIEHPLFLSPNAIALTSPTSFYVTNDHVFTRRLPLVGSVLPLIETFLALPLSFTAHVTLDPIHTAQSPVISHTIVAPFVAISNGIAISPSGLQVAIASSSTGSIHFYSRNTATNALTYTTSVLVPFIPDNLHYDHDGKLISAGHPHIRSLTRAVENKTAVAPSWVVSISPSNPQLEYDQKAPYSASHVVPPSANYTVQTLFQSNGKTFSTASTGLKDSLSGNLYVSGLYAEEGVIVCK
jgi:hypothetical protein